MRLYFWLLAMDVTSALNRATHRMWMHTVARAGELTDWGRGVRCGEKEPF